MTQGTALRLAIAAQPDLPWTDEQKRHASTAEMLSKIREGTLFIEGLTLPENGGVWVDNYSIGVSLTQYKEYGTYDLSAGETSLDVGASKKAMAKVVKQLPRPLTKKYTDYEFQVIYILPSGYEIKFTISRQTVCRSVVKDQEWVPPVEGHFREVTDFECDKVSFTDLEQITE